MRITLSRTHIAIRHLRMLLIRAGLSEADADAFLDRLRAEFAAGNLEDQAERLKFVEEELAEVRDRQRISPGRIENIITNVVCGVVSGLASAVIYEKSRSQSSSPDLVKPVTDASLTTNGKSWDRPYTVHVLVVNARYGSPIKDAHIELTTAVDLPNGSIVPDKNPFSIWYTEFPMQFRTEKDGIFTFAVSPNIVFEDTLDLGFGVMASAPGFSTGHVFVGYKGPVKLCDGEAVIARWPPNTLWIEPIIALSARERRVITPDKSVVIKLMPLRVNPPRPRRP